MNKELKKLKAVAGMNLKSPLLKIKHSSLKRFAHNDSMYKRACPACKEGTLLVRRNLKTFELEEFDYCILCGQQVRYTDIKKLRKGLKSHEF